jgi:hypothetical protein
MITIIVPKWVVVFVVIITLLVVSVDIVKIYLQRKLAKVENELTDALIKRAERREVSK